MNLRLSRLIDSRRTLIRIAGALETILLVVTLSFPCWSLAQPRTIHNYEPYAREVQLRVIDAQDLHV
jgi:hypothetical protein